MTLVARYAPKLLHWWMIRKTSRTTPTNNSKPTYFTDKDLELLKNAPGFQFLTAVRSIPVTLRLNPKQVEVSYMDAHWPCRTLDQSDFIIFCKFSLYMKLADTS